MSNPNEFIGFFKMEEKERIFGKITIAGKNTKLQVYNEDDLTPIINIKNIMGKLTSLEKITCIDCITSSINKKNTSEESYSNANIFPHFIALGDCFLDTDNDKISSISFTTQDIKTLFYDQKSFGHAEIPSSEIKTKYTDEAIEFTEHGSLFYFSGTFDILKAHTNLGDLSINNTPTFTGSGRNGNFLDNEVRITIDFKDHINFKESISRALSFQRFLSVLAGREQILANIKITKTDKKTNELSSLKLYWSNTPEEISNIDYSPDIFDIPINALNNPDEFKKIIFNWIERESEWKLARIRNHACANKLNNYNIDRLVSAANMYDILPSDVTPNKIELSPEISEAKKKCREIFKSLPSSPERDSILGALGRLGKPTLTAKILNRTAIIDKELGEYLPELELIVKIAVKTRNYFVHGSDTFDYKSIDSSIPFMTDTLEFIFSASDFIDAGWNAKSWYKSPHSTGHSFARFRWSYKQELNRLKNTLL
ncbi:hypothetical protein KAB52_000412 [Salmonella enterica subsp. salamae serovar 4,12:e,n,x:1,6]|nr:hypothetical protein [Salmonella enterica subsp. salamae serovar 4,12:e,n,x:1,6]